MHVRLISDTPGSRLQHGDVAPVGSRSTTGLGDIVNDDPLLSSVFTAAGASLATREQVERAWEAFKRDYQGPPIGGFELLQHVLVGAVAFRLFVPWLIRYVKDARDSGLIVDLSNPDQLTVIEHHALDRGKVIVLRSDRTEVVDAQSADLDLPQLFKAHGTNDLDE